MPACHASCKNEHFTVVAYSVEGENGCRVALKRNDTRPLRYRSTATVEEFVRQRKQWGEWAVITPTSTYGLSLHDSPPLLHNAKD